MAVLDIPVRYYKDYPGGYDYGYETLSLPLAECTFLLVDVDGTSPNPVTETRHRPGPGGGAAHVGPARRLRPQRPAPGGRPRQHRRRVLGQDQARPGTRRAPAVAGDAGPDFEPRYLDCVAPREGEPNFPKWIWSGFHDTFLDQHLRSWGTRTLIVVGYSRRACMHYTCAEAVGRNYRVVLLRDASNGAEIEFPDTIDDSIPEGGWLNKIVLRNFEHLIGYTTTSAEFVDACEALR